VPCPDLTENALVDINGATNDPIFPKHSDLRPGAKGGPVWLDHAKHPVFFPKFSIDRTRHARKDF
jgi:hypothetical protein